MGFDAVILAGDTADSRRVRGTNKALLEIGGVSLLVYVLAALQEASRVDGITIVGPRSRLEAALSKAQMLSQATKLRGIIEQKETLYENVWQGVQQILGTADPDGLPADSPERDRAILIVSADMPLVVGAEVDEFLGRCPVDRYDYCLGLTREDYLKPFYPRPGTAGIRLAYFPFAEGYFRINNLHLVKPLRIGSRNYIGKAYKYRYQKRWWNILRTAAELLRMPSALQVLWLYTLMHVSGTLKKLRLEGPSRFVRRSLSLRHLEEMAGRALGARLTCVETSFGGAALDVDKERDFAVISQMFESWRQFQLGLKGKRRAEEASRPGSGMAVGAA